MRDHYIKVWRILACLTITNVERLIDICYVYLHSRNLDENIFVCVGVGTMLISHRQST
ncbi:hypothetical protein NTGM5_170044 [Candidatus Nitrotoga sp. M5]|nr:hypothetical protein NTGM5_170044 [Candidatus Nitrotoga sp. M5]